MNWKSILLIVTVAVGIMIEHTTDACMVFRLKAGDGTVITGRSQEFIQDLKFDLIVVPRNMEIISPAPDGKDGATWKTRYGYVGVTQFGQEFAVNEGMNEKGVAVSGLWFEVDMKWQGWDPGKRAQTLAGLLVTDWILGNLDSVADIERELSKLKAVSYCIPWTPPFCPTLHFNACDSKGDCKVIEYEDGALHVYDNPLGIMTNAPRFPWQMTNLRQYIGLENFRPQPLEQSGITMRPTGHGAGMFGLPGDLTPPSRFVRLAAITRFAYRQPDAGRTLNLAQHIMNNFDIIHGMAIEPMPRGEVTAGKEVPSESTQWATFSDLTNRVLYFRTYDNFNLRKVEFKKLDFGAAKVKRIPMFGAAEAITDVSALAQ
jgi:choloylglycine hydrolase